MRKILLLLLFLTVTALSLSAGSGKAVLRIGDATRNGDNALRHAALIFALKNNVEITVNRVAAETALEKLRAGDFAIVIADRKDIPDRSPFPAEDHCWEALAVYVHPANPCRNLSLARLTQIIRERKISWREINGDRADIHRFTTSERAGNPGLMARMFPLPSLQSFVKLDSIEEILLMVADNQAAIGIAPMTISLPANVAAVKVENTAPSLSAVRKSRYPLTIHYRRLKADKISPEAEKFLDFLRSSDFDRILLDNGLIPPPPAGVSGQRKI